MDSLAVIIPAAGRSSRFGSNKLEADLCGKSVFNRSIEAFARRDDVKQIVVAGRTVDGSNKLRSVPGGACRAESVLLALHAVDPGIQWVAVHDAARPLVSQELIDRTFAEATRHGAAAPATPVHLTIKQGKGPLPCCVDRTIPRDHLWAMQTPQIARRSDLLAAFDSCPVPLEMVTDDMQLLEYAGQPVRLVAGDDWNLKITQPCDLVCAEFWLTQHVLANRL